MAACCVWLFVVAVLVAVVVVLSKSGKCFWAGKDRYLYSSKGTYVGVYVECTRSFLDQRDTLSPAQL